MTNTIKAKPCRYCGGSCPNDEDHACDGYLGDIDNLYNTHMTESILRARYEEYIENFDPSPQNYGDDYSTPPDFETWVIEQEEA